MQENKEERRTCCIVWDWGLSYKYGEDAIWLEYAISLANLAALYFV